MRILIDTHAFVRALSAPERLSENHRRELQSRSNSILLSSISVAEIMIKVSLNRIRFDQDPITCAEQLGFETLAFKQEDALLLRELPFHHRDPFDRMLIAQSVTQQTKLMSEDRWFRKYECDLI